MFRILALLVITLMPETNAMDVSGGGAYTYYNNPLVIPAGNLSKMLEKAIIHNDCDVVRLILSLDKVDVNFKAKKGAKSLADMCFDRHCNQCKTYFSYYLFIHSPQEFGTKLASLVPGIKKEKPPKEAKKDENDKIF